MPIQLQAVLAASGIVNAAANIPRFVEIVVGVGVALGGVWFFRTGAPIITSANRRYARLPGVLGGYRHPVWWHRLVGGLAVAWGLLVVADGVWRIS